MDKQKARHVVNNIRDLLDDGLGDASERFLDRHEESDVELHLYGLGNASERFLDRREELDVELHLLDSNLRITEHEDYFECIIPVQIKIAKEEIEEEETDIWAGAMYIVVDDMFADIIEIPKHSNKQIALNTWLNDNATQFTESFSLQCHKIQPHLAREYLQLIKNILIIDHDPALKKELEAFALRKCEALKKLE